MERLADETWDYKAAHLETGTQNTLLRSLKQQPVLSTSGQNGN